MKTDGAPQQGRRVALGALAAATVVSGLLVHIGVDGTLGDIAGDALYAVLVYLLSALALPRVAAALTAIAFCTVIELLQLTGVPAALSALFPPAALVLGSGFDARDLVVYAGAVLTASVGDILLARAARRRTTAPKTTMGALPKESAH